MSTHLHFGILTMDPMTGPATLEVGRREPMGATDDHGEVWCPARMFDLGLQGVLVDRGSWEVWGEPQNLEDPHQSLHVVACWPASPTEEQAAALRSRLLERIPTHCRIADAAILTDADYWSEVLATYVFSDPVCYRIPAVPLAVG